MKTNRILCLLLLACLSSGWTWAQSELNIETIFKDNGKKEGSTLIELATDVLGGHTRITKYKSLIMASDLVVIDSTMAAINRDLSGGVKLIESQKDGKIETGYYCLKRNGNSSYYEYILFRNKGKKMTLIYLKGNFPPQYLDKELDKLKDLFIKVNNKRIKLQ